MRDESPRDRVRTLYIMLEQVVQHAHMMRRMGDMNDDTYQHINELIWRIERRIEYEVMR